MVDAEHSYFQPAIDHAAMELQRMYNRRKPTVLNTYQCYLQVCSAQTSILGQPSFGRKLLHVVRISQDSMANKVIVRCLSTCGGRGDQLWQLRCINCSCCNVPQDSHKRLQLDMLRARSEGWHFGVLPSYSCSCPACQPCVGEVNKATHSPSLAFCMFIWPL